jgi:hypothetical protein
VRASSRFRGAKPQCVDIPRPFWCRSTRRRVFLTTTAVELALMTGLALGFGKKRGASVAPWQKVKIDRQIVAIAKSESVTDLYIVRYRSVRVGQSRGYDHYDIGDLPLPPVKTQPDLFETDDRSPRRK